MGTNILSEKLDLNKKNRVKLLIFHQENKAILADYLEKNERIQFSESKNLENADILIADEEGLKAKSKEIFKFKQKNRELFIPLLLLTRSSPDELSAQYLEIIDEIIEIPIKKRLLFSRIENLLNLRNLFLSTQIYQNLTENNPVGICILQHNDKIKYINRAFLKIIEKKKVNILDKNIVEVFPSDTIKEYLLKSQEKLEEDSNLKIEINNHKKWLNIRSSEIQFKNQKLKILIFVDISAQKKSEEKIRYLSFHDQLTGLYNRNYFMEEIERLDTRRKFPITIIMADINKLKLINDIFGHDKGDQLIKKTADILAENIRESDIL
ncbi:MAG: diguanylate cyclase, partial [Bacillota bacterium]